MATLLDRPHKLVSYQFTIANVLAGTGGTSPVAGILAGGNGMNGPIVPTGYRFAPVHIDVETNDARTAGVSTVKVTEDATALSGGPEAVLNATNTTRASGSVSGDPDTVAAGAEIGVAAYGDGTFAPTTADLDVVLYGYFLPAAS